jgi:hypothetical protein
MSLSFIPTCTMPCYLGLLYHCSDRGEKLINLAVKLQPTLLFTQPGYLENSLSIIPCLVMSSSVELLYHYLLHNGEIDVHSIGSTQPSFPLANPGFSGKCLVPHSSLCHAKLPKTTLSLLTTEWNS